MEAAVQQNECQMQMMNGSKCFGFCLEVHQQSKET